jgi:hypothetical protein
MRLIPAHASPIGTTVALSVGTSFRRQARWFSMTADGLLPILASGSDEEPSSRINALDDNVAIDDCETSIFVLL